MSLDLDTGVEDDGGDLYPFGNGNETSSDFYDDYEAFLQNPCEGYVRMVRNESGE